MTAGEVKGWESRSRRETESEKGEGGSDSAQSAVIDPKPGDLAACRLKLR